jgi:hypothetical protein
MTAVQQEFNFDSFMFDDFYPLNGILENVTDLSNIDIDVNDRAA